MSRYTPGIAYRRGEKFPHVEFWTQPFFWRMVAKFYHWYESKTENIMKKFSPWHEKRFGAEEEDYVSLLSRREIRSAHLTYKKRTTLAIIYTTMEQHDAITGRTSPVVGVRPRHEVMKPVEVPEIEAKTEE